MSNAATQATVAQAQETVGIRIYAKTQAALLRLQADAVDNGDARRTYADLVDAAVNSFVETARA